MQRKFIFDGSLTKRYHTVPTHKEQNIAAHSFGVAWFCELLTRGTASKNLIMAALAHDLAEHMVGDIPGPSKRAMNMSKAFHDYETTHLRTAGLGTYQDSLNEGEAMTLKLADMMEGMMYCIQERLYGNRNIDVVYGRFKKYAVEVVNKYRQLEAPNHWVFDEQTFYTFMKEMTEEMHHARSE